MPSNTQNYNLELYDRANDKDELFIDFRDKLAGTGTSNMVIIDGEMKQNADDIISLAGGGRTTETVKTNNDLITTSKQLSNDHISFTMQTTGINAYTSAFLGSSPDITTLVNGLKIDLIINTTNTGSCSLNPSNLGTKDILITDGNGNTSPLVGGELKVGTVAKLIYNGTAFILMGVVDKSTILLSNEGSIFSTATGNDSLDVAQDYNAILNDSFVNVELFGKTGVNLVSGEDVADAGTVSFDSILNNIYWDSLNNALLTGTGASMTATNTSGGVADMMIIDMNSLGLESKTADEMNNLFPTYFDGMKSVENAVIRSEDLIGDKTSILKVNETIRSLPNGVKDRVYRDNGKWYKETNVSEITLISGKVINTTNIPLASATSQFITKDKVGLVNGAITTTESTVVQYQLATPVTTEITVDGALEAYKNGTIYTSSDTFHPSTKITYPLSNKSAILSTNEEVLTNSNKLARLTNKVDNFKIYGIEIDESNSNPLTRVTYTDDAIGFTPCTGNNGAFDWGDWEDIIQDGFKIKPCVLNNPEKTVNYYLDPTDYTKKEDGTASILDGTDGDVMTEFGVPLYYSWTTVGTIQKIKISTTPFQGSVRHAFDVEDGYNQMTYYSLLLTQMLFVMMFKSTDSQTALGRGYVDANAVYATSGNTDAKGFNYGETTGKLQNKFLGIEDYYGNKLYWIDGLVTDANWNLLIGSSAFNDTGIGYTLYPSGATADIVGYINTVQGGDSKGFIIDGNGGSASTYYCDYGNLYSSRVAVFGGSLSGGSNAGFAYLRLISSAASTIAIIGARLSCAKNGKLYVGAYLGTTQVSKLRSVSGTVISGSKTIGTFRTEAQANV